MRRACINRKNNLLQLFRTTNHFTGLISNALMAPACPSVELDILTRARSHQGAVYDPCLRIP
ncbi:MAG: hypothetical protein KAR19_01795 [Bacteroidales bacterium]|nr:hypothetical protein [Bacteroidales bacterium]